MLSSWLTAPALLAQAPGYDAGSADPTRHAVTPPVLESDARVAYPAEALEASFRESVTVDVVLDVDANGAVRDVTLERAGHAAFDEAALSAARGLRFRPAEREGRAIAARIRFRYVFHPPPRPLPDPVEAENAIEAPPVGIPPAAAPPVISPPPAAAVPEALEVTVRGERSAPAAASFTRTEVRQLPGAFGDPFRAVEVLPGVTPIVSGLPFFYVRGAPPGNVGYFLDGVRVPFLYHVFIGPSVVHPGVVERVDLHPGGYPARLGRFAGGVVSAETTAPRAETHGEAVLRVFDAGALAETGFAGGRGTILLGGRYSYTAAIFSLLAQDLKLDYRDYQARVTYDVTDDDRLSLFAFGSYDLLAREQGGALDVLFGAEFYRLRLGHERKLSGGSLQSEVTLGFDQSHMNDEGNVVDRSLAVRTELRQRLDDDVLLRAGIDATADAYASDRPRYADPENPEVRVFLDTNPDRTDGAFGLWNDFVIDVARDIELTPGLRLDLFRSRGTSALGVDPRIAARFAVSERLTLVHTFGVAHQPPSFTLPMPGRVPATLDGGLQQSVQTSAGAELELGDGTFFGGSLFQNAFFDTTDVLAINADGPPSASVERRSDGSAVGLEVLVRRSVSRRLSGLFSYTLSRSIRRLDGRTFPSAFDRTHVLNLAAGYDLGRGYRAGARFVFYTGTPDLEDPDGRVPHAPAENPPRGDPFYRLDLRFEKRWRLAEQSFVSCVAEVVNATLGKESFGEEEIGPVTIPSVGVEVGF